MFRLAASGIFAFLVVSCGVSPETDAPAAEEPNLFSPEICTLPRSSINKRLERLGAGTWQPAGDDADARYNCGATAGVVRIYEDGSGSIDITFVPLGTKAGANMVVMEYRVLSEHQISNESTHRNMFARFADEMTGKLLGQSLPEFAIKRMGNLNSFSSSPGDTESFDAGRGFVLLERYRIPTEIRIRIKVFPDQRMKLNR
jgi:hypothetical protein